MTTVHVAWEPLAEGCNRGVWDQAIIERLLAGRYRPPRWPDFTHHDTLTTVPEGEGAVVVLPARHHASLDDLRRLNGFISRLPWVLLILNGDEEHCYPAGNVKHPNLRLWVQTPDPYRTYPPGTRFLVNGPAPHAYEARWRPKTLDVAFSGQVTHSRRVECAAAVKAVLDSGRTGELIQSAGFTQGIDPAEYVALMALARLCPAPSGPVCVDSFRAYEAMELGAVPVLDATLPDGRNDQIFYWDRVAPGVPAPIAPSWDALAVAADEVLDGWPRDASRAAAWWQGYQRDLARHLVEDLATLGASLPDPAVDDQITVIVPTSPIPSHPSTQILTETVTSIRAQLPTAGILILADGPNPSVEQYRQAYEEYLYEVARLCREEWWDVLPVIHGEHLHQSGMLRHAFNTGLIDTPLMLWAEHDCPIRGHIDWPALTAAVTSGDAGIIRLHHEASIHPEHEYLMRGPVQHRHGAPLRPTAQYSARPHLAATDLYQRALTGHFEGLTCMLEDKLHSVVQATPWDDWRLWIYTPDQDDEGHGYRRSWHTDGRAGDPKWIGEIR